MRCASSATSATCCRAASSWRRRTCGTASPSCSSLKMTDPQFSGQTKERLSSRQAAGFVEGAAHDAFSLWLNQHVELGEQIAQLAIERASGAPEDREADRPQEGHPGPCPARQAGRLHQPGPVAHRAVPGRRRLRRRQRQAGARQGLPGDPAAARQDPQHLGSGQSGSVLASHRSARPRRGDRLRSGQGRHRRPALRQGHHPGRRRLRRPAHRHPAGGAVPAPFPGAGRGRPRLRGDAAAVPRRRGQAGVLRAGRGREAHRCSSRSSARRSTRRRSTSPASRAWAR